MKTRKRPGLKEHMEQERMLAKGELRSYVTTEGDCSNCGAKLSNAETSRLEWQDEAHRLGMENEQLKHACNTLQVQFDALAQAHQSKISEIDRTIGELRQQLSIYSTLRNPAIAESYKPI